jgi:CRISPR/Cas system CSM-associated protein Csm3 (group 7 of RAMP superfamily)
MATKTFNYSITFLSDWHAGSGLGAGAKADAIVVKDEHNLPFLPGKTIKGLLKDAIEDIKGVQPNLINGALVEKLFGREKEDKSTQAGDLFFSNATLPETEQLEISKELSEFLYRTLSSTTIDENGVAKDRSLRTMEVTVPLTLEGKIIATVDFSEDERDLLRKAMLWTRALGSNRNRGLGRCKIELKA